MGCPTIHGPPEAAESALWACANTSVDTAVFSLVLCFGLLVATVGIIEKVLMRNPF